MGQNPAMLRFLGRLQPDLARSFSSEQLAAVELHFGMRHRPAHAIDWRARIRLPFLHFYLVILAGRDFRQPE